MIVLIMCAILPLLTYGYGVMHPQLQVRRLFDYGAEHALVEDMQGHLQSVNMVTHKKVSVPCNRGTLLGAKFASRKQILQYVKDEDFHTVYTGDRVVMGALNPVIAMVPYRTKLLTLAHGGEIMQYNFESGESRSLLCARHYRDSPTCVRVHGDYLFMGTLLGSLIVVKESDMTPVLYERYLLCTPVSAVSVVPDKKNKCHLRVTTHHADCSDKVFEMSVDSKSKGIALQSEPSVRKSPYVSTCVDFAVTSETHVVKGLTNGMTIVYDQDMNTLLQLPYGTCRSPILKSDRLVYHCRESGEIVVLPLGVW